MQDEYGFDPFTATLEEAQAHPKAYDLHGAVIRWGAAQYLTGRRTYYETNTLEAVSWCAVNGLLMPEWLVTAYLSAYRKVLKCEVSSWDKAFGPPFRKGAKLPQLKRKRLTRPAVWLAVVDKLKQAPETPINRVLFDEIGEQFSMSGVSAERLYYEHEALNGLNGILRSRQRR